MQALQSGLPATCAIGQHARMLTGTQIRMALVALGWTYERLAQETGLSEATINRACKPEGVPDVRASTLAKIQETMEKTGTIFIAKDAHGGPGVRLR